MNCWETLLLEPTSDKLAIKKAYVKLLKQTNPEDDALAYQDLREAYEDALREAEYLEENELDETGNTFPAEEINPDTAVYSPWLNTGDTDSRQAVAHDPGTLHGETNDTIPTDSDNDQDVGKLLNRLQETLENKGAAAAVEYFNEIKNHELLHALDNEYRFEGELMLLLHLAGEKADEFLIAVGDHFNWSSDNNPFTYDHNYNYAHYAVSQRLLEARFKQAVRQEFLSVRESEWKRVFPTLLDLLNEDELEALYQSELRGLVSSILSFAGGHENHSYRQLVDTEIMQWWWGRASEDDVSPAVHTGTGNQAKNDWQDDNSTERGPGFYYYWLIFWIILVVIRVATHSSGS